MEVQELQVQVEQVEHQVLQVRQGQVEVQELLVRQERVEHQVQMEVMVLQAALVHLAQTGWQELQEHQVLMV